MQGGGFTAGEWLDCDAEVWEATDSNVYVEAAGKIGGQESSNGRKQGKELTIDVSMAGDRWDDWGVAGRLTTGPDSEYALPATAIEDSSAWKVSFILDNLEPNSDFGGSWMMRMSLNDSTAPIASISESDTLPFDTNAAYPASTQLDIQYFRPNKILSTGARFIPGIDCEEKGGVESSAWIAMFRRLKQRQSVDILRTDIHSSFDTWFL